MLEIRNIDLERDYAEFKSWWKAWGWEPFPKPFLPETGLVVYEGNTNICAVWLYRTDTAICWVENMISNKEYKGKRNEAILLLLSEIEKEAKSQGFKMIITATKCKGLVKKFIDSGYIESDKAMEHFVRVV